VSARGITTTARYQPAAVVTVTPACGGAYLDLGALDRTFRGVLLPIRGWSR